MSDCERFVQWQLQYHLSIIRRQHWIWLLKPLNRLSLFSINEALQQKQTLTSCMSALVSHGSVEIASSVSLEWETERRGKRFLSKCQRRSSNQSRHSSKWSLPVNYEYTYISPVQPTNCRVHSESWKRKQPSRGDDCQSRKKNKIQTSTWSVRISEWRQHWWMPGGWIQANSVQSTILSGSKG